MAKKKMDGRMEVIEKMLEFELEIIEKNGAEDR